MPDFSIMDVANHLRLSYTQARDLVLKRGMLEKGASGKYHVTEDSLKLLLGETKQVLNIPKVAFDPTTLPPLPQGIHLVPKKTLIASLPLIGDMVHTEALLEGCLVHGRWRCRVINRVNKYMFQDFKDVDSWASPRERNVGEMAAALYKAWMAEKKADRKAVLDKLLQVARGWQNMLREERGGLKRATGNLKPAQFTQDYEGAKERFYSTPWEKNKEVRALFPPDFKVL